MGSKKPVQVPGAIVRKIDARLGTKDEDFRDIINLHATGKMSTAEAMKRYDRWWLRVSQASGLKALFSLH